MERRMERVRNTKIGENNSFTNGSRRIRRVRSLRSVSRAFVYFWGTTLKIAGEKRPKALAASGGGRRLSETHFVSGKAVTKDLWAVCVCRRVHGVQNTSIYEQCPARSESYGRKSRANVSRGERGI